MAVTLDTLKKTIGKKKAKSMAFSWLADYEFMAGDVDNALARVDAGLQLYPGDIPGMLVRTKILFQKGEFDECVKECERILLREPFCLSAQKRMGEAYEQLGDENERNKCYRRVHDMDPLDSFWKEEYEVVADAAAAAGAAAAAMGDSEFAMPDMDLGAEATTEAPAESETAEAPAEEAPAAEEAGAAGSLFDKSLDMDIDTPAEEAAPEFTLDEAPAEPAKPASPFSMAEDDPFAALKSLGVEDDSVDESAMDSLESSLNSAMDSAATDITLDEDAAPSEEISGNDVDSAFANFFGDETDDLETEPTQSSAPASPFAQMDLPTSLEDEPAASSEVKEENIFGSAEVEDKPQSIDDAFGDIFGEDELPEELPASAPAQSAPAAEESSFGSGLFDKSADSDMGFGLKEDGLSLADDKLEPVEPEDKPQSIDDAFGDIFGEDELPEEKPVEPAAEVSAPEQTSDLDFNMDAGGSLFEKSAEEADLSMNLEEPALEEPAPAEPAEDLSMGLELPAEEAPAEAAPATDDVLDLDSEDLTFGEEKPAEEESALAEEPAVEEPVAEEPAAIEPAVEEPAADELVLDDAATVEPVAEEPVAEETVVEEPKASEVDGGINVESAFDALFADDDELPEEKPAEELPEAETSAGAEPVAEVSTATTSEDKVTEGEDSLSQEMGDAFSALFSDDDDLPVDEAKSEVAEAPEATQEDTGAAIEEAPLADAALESDLDKSFSSLFGEDDSLTESEPAAQTPAEEELAPAAETETKPASDHESLESEFSGAFKELFNMDDDSLDEKETPPSNKGMDFLMSGDSDDEVSAGLTKDPTAPLDKLPTDLDESLNTPTLAEIYFEQGLYGKAMDIYQDLARKEPENETIRKRLEEIEMAYRNKFGDNANG